MTATNDQQQKDLIRDRFTRTAEVFSNFAVKERVREAETLARLVAAGPNDRAVDLASGPGTLALRFARHVRSVVALDLTPAILRRAQQSARADAIENLFCTLGDATALPLADASLDVVVTSYSLHHIREPERVVREMARVLRPGGRAGVLDMLVPEDPRAAALRNRIEIARDPSHTRALSKSELERLFTNAGLRVRTTQIDEHIRSFDHWLNVAGWHRGDREYIETRRILEASMRSGEDSGFYPRFAPVEPDAPDSEPDIELTQTSLFVAGERP
ncbi:MAG TPA: methyltransferase domain-containing protein [Candidatus Acidoferrum sp.]|nr:methyltransferase domain-containing protein [Candidatus Acidoferrum sp.]